MVFSSKSFNSVQLIDAKSASYPCLFKLTVANMELATSFYLFKLKHIVYIELNMFLLSLNYISNGCSRMEKMHTNIVCSLL